MAHLYLPRLPLIADETLGSYVWRQAATSGVTPLEMMARAGLIQSRNRNLPKLVLFTSHLLLTAEQRGRVTAQLHLDRGAVNGMLLNRYEGTLFAHAPPVTSLDDVMTWAATHHLRIHDPWYCPACLAEEGAWRLPWYTPWTPVCPRHGTLLEQHCPQCGQPPAWGAVTPRSRQSLLEAPGAVRCANATTGRKGCGRDLSLPTGAAPVLAQGPLMLTQVKVDQLLHGDAAVGLAGPTPAFFQRLAQQVRLLMLAGELQDLGPLPEACAVVFHQHAAARNEQLSWSMRKSRGRHDVPLPRFWSMPTSPLLMAAVLPQAFTLATLPEQERARAQRSLLDRHPVLHRAPGTDRVLALLHASTF